LGIKKIEGAIVGGARGDRECKEGSYMRREENCGGRRRGDRVVEEESL
jgi:hypothetical protein